MAIPIITIKDFILRLVSVFKNVVLFTISTAILIYIFDSIFI